jgi:hypothetical protein
VLWKRVASNKRRAGFPVVTDLLGDDVAGKRLSLQSSCITLHSLCRCYTDKLRNEVGLCDVQCPFRARFSVSITRQVDVTACNKGPTAPSLTRELVLGVTHLYAVGIYRLGGTDDVSPLLLLLVKLLFDARTTPQFRKTIAVCLSRLLESEDERIGQTLSDLLIFKGCVGIMYQLFLVRIAARRKIGYVSSKHDRHLSDSDVSRICRLIEMCTDHSMVADYEGGIGVPTQLPLETL